MLERIQKIIATAGYCSRRAAETLIQDGRVTVNGKIPEMGEKADSALDNIEIDGISLNKKEENTYIMLNKPTGYVTTMNDEHDRPTVAELVSDLGVRVYPVGRLDMDSQGMLIMTNDGELTNKLTHPSSEIDKCYETRVLGKVDEKVLELLRSPLIIDGYKINPAKVKLYKRFQGGAVLHITISEGKNRQVRKMCATCALEVVSLKRISEGELLLGDLAIGTWRRLDKKEVENLQK